MGAFIEHEMVSLPFIYEHDCGVNPTLKHFFDYDHDD